MAADTFFLLLPETACSRADGPLVEILGERWILEARRDFPTSEEPEDYACISYVWGDDRVPHPFELGGSISRRTLSVLDEVVSSQRPNAIWIDALCVPFREPQRSVCLRNLGRIYGQASLVIVVLSSVFTPVLERLERDGDIDEARLLELERDDWITRAWTYQEVSNSRSLRFLADGGRGLSIDADPLLTQLVYAIDAFKRSHSYDAFRMRSLHPRLNALESLLADWMRDWFPDRPERFGYQIMSGMDGRISSHLDGSSAAMSAALPKSSEREEPNMEVFMNSCEAENDFSFVYSSAPRSNLPGKCWRPQPGSLPPVLPWISEGVGQSGRLRATHVELDGMSTGVIGRLESHARRFIERWFSDDPESSPEEWTPSAIHRRLVDGGFSGCGDWIELTQGYFFPQLAIENPTRVGILVATGVRWDFGAPGLAVEKTEWESEHCLGVGVFVGVV